MREFMHYITNAFYGATEWNEDNTYKELNATARELIDFPLPLGLRVNLASLATPHFATSYQLGTVGIVDGSISYLYSSVALRGVAAQSDRIPLPALLRSFRRLHDLGSRGDEAAPNAGGPGASASHAVSIDTDGGVGLAPTHVGGNKVTGRDRDKSSLLYGRLYLPQSLLEGLVVKRFSPVLQVQLSAVSEQSLRNGGTLLGLIQYDKGKFGVEGLASTDGGLLGVRGLYNLGGDASSPGATPTACSTNESSSSSSGQSGERERIYGRFSVGGEVYYGTLNKSGGMSLGARFATLPAHRGTPLTAALTINPLMGNINATYAILAKEYCSMATRMEFNVYSYESDWAVGMELWSNRRPAGFLLGVDPNRQREEVAQKLAKTNERSFQAKMEWRLDGPEPTTAAEEAKVPAGQDTPGVTKEEEYLGVLKARLDQNLRIGLLWEGRVKSLIFSLGTGVDLHKLDEPFRSLGLEIQYSS
ncbi:hypothetical protein B0T24DRAFT_194637 [Lasiosphaeria ovina]|uniref:Mitochondrial distribution and morphology protein 10 n=1 Tax=Lasiosphaeria ovina TaxID=92902 RepID=A0AAE0NF92_9PEZI|nr:hypothetical protein B0T24DRAFT_194637 [Lasiosphaeria ovina]